MKCWNQWYTICVPVAMCMLKIIDTSNNAQKKLGGVISPCKFIKWNNNCAALRYPLVMDTMLVILFPAQHSPIATTQYFYLLTESQQQLNHQKWGLLSLQWQQHLSQFNLDPSKSHLICHWLVTSTTNFGTWHGISSNIGMASFTRARRMHTIKSYIAIFKPNILKAAPFSHPVPSTHSVYH